MTRFPAEWEKQSAVLIAWPHKIGDFSNRLESVEQSYSVIADTITQYQKLLIVCRDNSHQQHIQTLVSKPDAIDFIHASVNDIWVRDTVFLSVEQEGAITHLNFLFNGWGEKYQHQNDNALNHKLLNAKPFKGKAHKDIDFILEGGSVESDGIDTILTTKQCLLNPNRNKGLTQQRNRTATVSAFRCETGILAGPGKPVRRRHRCPHRYPGPLLFSQHHCLHQLR